MHNSRRRRLILAVGIVIAILFATAAPAAAASWSSTTLALSNTTPSASGVTYTFNFSGASTTGLQCIVFTWTVNSDGTGGAPAGFDVQTASWGSSTFVSNSGWNKNNNGSNGFKVNGGSTNTPATSGNIVINGITNGSSAGTVYASIKTYRDQNCNAGDIIDTAVFGTSWSSGGSAYTGNSTLTVSAGSSFSMAVTGYNGASCNGATITGTTSSGTALPVGSISPTSSGVVGQTITVNSTANGGYNVTVKHTGLTDGNGHTIAPFSGTNATPAVMPGAGTEGLGYTTEWTTLNTTNGPANRFAGNKWAGLTASAGEVMYRASGATSAPGDVARVCYQVNMSNLTTNGNYTDVITYTATPSF